MLGETRRILAVFAAVQRRFQRVYLGRELSDLSALRGHGLRLLLEQGFDFLKVALNRGRIRRGGFVSGAFRFFGLDGKGLAKGVNFRRDKREEYREGELLPVE